MPRGEKRWNKDRGEAGQAGSKVHGRNAWYVEDDHEETNVPKVPKDFALRLQERSTNFSFSRPFLRPPSRTSFAEVSSLLAVFSLERRNPAMVYTYIQLQDKQDCESFTDEMAKVTRNGINDSPYFASVHR